MAAVQITLGGGVLFEIDDHRGMSMIRERGHDPDVVIPLGEATEQRLDDILTHMRRLRIHTRPRGVD